MSIVDAHLEIDPEQVIEFTLVDGAAAADPKKVTLTLKNPDAEGLPIAFKVSVVLFPSFLWIVFGTTRGAISLYFTIIHFSAMMIFILLNGVLFFLLKGVIIITTTLSHIHVPKNFFLCR